MFSCEICEILKSTGKLLPPNKFPPGFELGFGLGSGAIFRGGNLPGGNFPSTLKNDYFCVLITSSYIDFYNSLKYTFFIFTSNFFFITQLKQ